MAGRQIRRGTAAERVALGGLAAGELGFETDTEDVYIGAAAGDELISDKSARDFLNGQDQAVKTTSGPSFPFLSTVPVKIVPPGMDFIDEPTNPTLLPGDAGETCRIMEGDTCHLWYAGGGAATDLYYTYASDSSCKTFAAPVLCLSNIRFPYVVKHGAMYYLFARDSTSGLGIFMWSSPDKVTWTIMNGGVQVISNEGSASIYYTVYNCGVVIIDDIFHMFIECGKEFDQSDVGLGYSYSTLAAMAWDANKTAAHVVAGGGSPSPIYVPDRNAILLLHAGLNYSQAGYWDLAASYADIDDDLSLAASWKSAPFFNVHYNNMHTADPDFMVAGPTKDHNIIVGFYYAQKDSYQIYYDLTLDEFFDAATAYDSTKFTDRNFVIMGCPEADGVPGIYPGGTEADIGINIGAKGKGIAHLTSPLDVTGSGRFTGTPTSVLTGSIDPIASATVTGVGTKFLTELMPGDRITVSAETRTVIAIASDTSLTVDAAFSDNANDTSPDKLAAIYIGRNSAGAVKVVVNDLGYVGIGTLSPSDLLTVNGDASFANIAGKVGSSEFWIAPLPGTSMGAIRITNAGIHEFWTNAGAVGIDFLNGTVNITGTYKVATLQVIGARVVDARADDAINAAAWDATTAGVLESLRDAAITHGWIKAA